MNQSSLDIWEVRGLSGIIRMLEARADDPVKYTPQTRAALASYIDRLQKVLDKMEVGEDSDATSDVERMDRWFATGLDSLGSYLHQRISDGPPITHRYWMELVSTLHRMMQDVTIHETGVSITDDEQKAQPGTA
jgi:hypothetical protein